MRETAREHTLGLSVAQTTQLSLGKNSDPHCNGGNMSTYFYMSAESDQTENDRTKPGTYYGQSLLFCVGVSFPPYGGLRGVLLHVRGQRRDQVFGLPLVLAERKTQRGPSYGQGNTKSNRRGERLDIRNTSSKSALQRPMPFPRHPRQLNFTREPRAVNPPPPNNIPPRCPRSSHVRRTGTL